MDSNNKGTENNVQFFQIYKKKISNNHTLLFAASALLLDVNKARIKAISKECKKRLM